MSFGGCLMRDRQVGCSGEFRSGTEAAEDSEMTAETVRPLSIIDIRGDYPMAVRKKCQVL